MAGKEYFDIWKYQLLSRCDVARKDRPRIRVGGEE